MSFETAEAIFNIAKEKGVKLPETTLRYSGFDDDVYNIYSIEDLMEILPREIEGCSAPFAFVIIWESNEFCVGYRDLNNNYDFFYKWSEEDESLTEALGKLLVWCIEEGHVK
jgi:hypothetical protein